MKKAICLAAIFLVGSLTATYAATRVVDQNIGLSQSEIESGKLTPNQTKAKPQSLPPTPEQEEEENEEEEHEGRDD